MTKTFRDLGVDPALCDALADGGITHPFPIQELTLPLALDGHDLIGQARTGTGKTLAFGLPLLQRLDASKRRTQALVIVPTRELCLQVHADLQVGVAKGLTTISVYGGVGYDEQIDALTGGVQVVVGTPGRLLDLLNRGVLDLSNVTQLVLDEADEMLDMGFLPDVERLVEACTGEDRHTMLFSATMPTAIVKLARRYMDHPTFTRADHEQKNTAPLVTQYFFQVHRMDKPRLLARILQSKDRGGVYVFVRTKHMADRLVNDLEDLRVPSIAIHGDLRQSTREKNLDRFRAGKATVLVCTEVAARGLDVSGVTHVVNYDCPDDEKMYLHRIGRTARAGEAGVAITFAEFNEIDRLNVIRKAVGATDSEVEQVFSTSKNLKEMFDLPDERPWDHLSTKAGGDEARARREDRADDRAKEDDGGRGKGGRGKGGRGSGGRSSGGRPGSTDGRPKNTRTSEGRGGDHDSRRSRKAETPPAPAADQTDRGAPVGDTPVGSEAVDATAVDTTAVDATAVDATAVDASAVDATAEARGGSDRAEQERSEPRARADRRERPSRDAASGTRTRTRTRARSDAPAADRSGSNDRDGGGDEPTSRSRARAGDSDPATGSRSPARRRARGGQRAGGDGEETPTSTARGSGSVDDASEEPTSATSGEAADDRQDASGGSSSGGRARDSSRRGESGSSERSRGRGRSSSRRGGRSGRAATGGDTAEAADSRSKGEGNGRSSSDDRSSNDERSSGNARGRGARDGRRGSRSGGSRNSRSGSAGGRSGNAGGRSGSAGGRGDLDATVQVADRGAEARGDGQPQPARRVKVEHLP